MYPIGRTDLKIKWDENRLQKLYEDEELIKQTGMDFEKSNLFAMPNEKLRKAEERAEKIYNRYAKGVDIGDAANTIRKIPYKNLPRAAKLEVKLIEGGFFDQRTGKISTKYKGAKDEDD